MNYYDQFIEKSKEGDTNQLISFVLAHGDRIVNDVKSSKTWHLLKKQDEKAIVKEYKYMITFTCDPKKVNIKDNAQLCAIEAYIKKLLLHSDNFRFYYTMEHKETNPHWHVIIHRYKAFPQDQVAYYKKKYGNVDISKSFDVSDAASVKYLGKENKITVVK